MFLKIFRSRQLIFACLGCRTYFWCLTFCPRRCREYEKQGLYCRLCFPLHNRVEAEKTGIILPFVFPTAQQSWSWTAFWEKRRIWLLVRLIPTVSFPTWCNCSQLFRPTSWRVLCTSVRLLLHSSLFPRFQWIVSISFAMNCFYYNFPKKNWHNRDRTNLVIYPEIIQSR